MHITLNVIVVVYFLKLLSHIINMYHDAIIDFRIENKQKIFFC